MKVVLFCGGFGIRLREYSETVPKPMVPIGYRPIVWHLMKYYAHYGHTDFVLCLGYRGDLIKQYFLKYDECVSNDFVLSNGGQKVHVFNRDIKDWTITFVDTGPHANIGQRLKAAAPYLTNDDVFLANYSDGLTDLNLNEYLDRFRQQDKILSFLCVQPTHSFHVVTTDSAGNVADIRHVHDAGIWINGGFFACKKEVLNYIKDGEDLVEEPFQRLIRDQQIMAQRYDGFWACMDTLKDKQGFDERAARGDTPWEIWRRPGPPPPGDHAPSRDSNPRHGVRPHPTHFRLAASANRP